MSIPISPFIPPPPHPPLSPVGVHMFVLYICAEPYGLNVYYYTKFIKLICCNRTSFQMESTANKAVSMRQAKPEDRAIAQYSLQGTISSVNSVWSMV